MSTTEKRSGRGRYSIKIQFTLIFFFLMLGAISLCWIINSTFLERYYTREKRIALTQMFNEVNEASNNNSIDSDEFDEKVSILAGTENVSLIVMDAESSTVKMHASDSSAMVRRMWDNLFGQTPSIEEREKIRSQYYVYRTLSDTDNYSVRIIYDSRMDLKVMELFGVLDDGSFCLLSTVLESIHNSTAIANRFMGYVGIAISLLGALFALFLAGKLTQPIRELTEISARMKKLDFSAKYKGHSRTEIAELGENINELSEILEKTISELKTANNELREDIERKEKTEEMRREFLSNVTHELKTPLALIKGYAEGLSEGVAEDPDSIRFYTDVIVDEADKMNRMVARLLSLNQLEFGDTQFTLNNAGVLAEQKQISVRMEERSPLYVWSDEFWTEEVFMNYFSNAVNHCDGEKVIDIHFEEKQNCVRVVVFNTGKPIPEESVPHLWEKFYKVDKARTRAYGGSGVGLSVVKAIMDQLHQGYGVTNYDNGVSFWFELEKAAVADTAPGSAVKED